MRWVVGSAALLVLAACGGGTDLGDAAVSDGGSRDARVVRRDAVVVRLDSSPGPDSGPPGCLSDSECPGEFCESPLGQCDAAGACAAIPSDCTDDLQPVCGCDGMTYSNDCQRQAAAVGRAYEGICSPIGDVMCDETRPCPSGEFCEFTSCDGAGFCRALAVAADCPAITTRLCGCDGVTYMNDCQRRAAGVRSDHLGECAVNECALETRLTCCFDDSDCIASRCRGASCSEGGEGRCHIDALFGGCWSDDDCGASEHCEDVRICPCGDICLLPDSAGDCVAD